MPDRSDLNDELLDLAAPILIYDAFLYEREVLLLPRGQTEDGLDEELATAARELGITDTDRCLVSDQPDLSTAISTLTVSSEHRSSISIRSHSTGFTSHPSRASREQHLDTSFIGLTALPTRPSYDSVLESIRPKLSHSRSSSTASTPASNPFHLAARKFGLRRKRGHMPSIFRRDSSISSKPRHDKTATSSPRPSISAQSSGTSLECGHTVSKFSIRMHVKEATGSDDYLPPSCCGKPIPGAVLETVMSKAEMDELVRGLVQTYGLEAGNDLSPLPSPAAGIRSAPPERVNFPEPSDLGLHSYQPMTEDAIQSELVIDPAYRVLRKQYSEEIERFQRFEYLQKKALKLHHDRTRATVWALHTHRREEFARKHELALEQLEETQICVELEMRDTHIDETQRVATALKYMERYCQENPRPTTPSRDSGMSNSLEELLQQKSPQRHMVSEEDRIKLKRQYAIRDNLPQKHSSAINVLRAKQEKEFKIRQEKQAREVSELILKSEWQISALEAAHTKESGRLDNLIDNRRSRLRARWHLRMEMWGREYERGKGPIHGRMCSVEWPEAIPLDAELCQAGNSAPSALDALVSPHNQGDEEISMEINPFLPLTFQSPHTSDSNKSPSVTVVNEP